MSENDVMKKNKVDLHIHTYYSDGQASPADIVKRAAELGYEKISITDHDGTDGIAEALEAGKETGIEVVTGIELASKTEEGIGIHILGYGFDLKDRSLEDTLGGLQRKRRDRNEKLIRVLNDLGCEVSLEELTEKQPGGFIGKPVIARTLAEKGYVKDYKDAFKRGQFLGSDEARAIKKEKIPASEAIAMLKAAGGMAVMAHPIQTKGVGAPGSEGFYSRMEEIIDTLRSYGLEGLECHHPDQDKEQTERFTKIAERYGLRITRGSDFHGLDFADADPTA